MVARTAPDRAELVKDEVIRETIRRDQSLMDMFEMSLAQVAGGIKMIPLDEVKARYAGHA